MPTTLFPAEAAPAPAPAAPPVLRRLLADLRIALPVSLLAGLVITLATGYPESLYEQLVYSVWIGLIAFCMVDLARLLVWPGPQRRAHQWLAFLGLMLLASLVGHFAASTSAPSSSTTRCLRWRNTRRSAASAWCCSPSSACAR